MSRHPPEPAPPYSASPTTSVITTSFSLRQNRRRMAEVVFQAAGESDKFVGLTSRIGSHRENFPLNGVLALGDLPNTFSKITISIKGVIQSTKLVNLAKSDDPMARSFACIFYKHEVNIWPPEQTTVETASPSLRAFVLRLPTKFPSRSGNDEPIPPSFQSREHHGVRYYVEIMFLQRGLLKRKHYHFIPIVYIPWENPERLLLGVNNQEVFKWGEHLSEFGREDMKQKYEVQLFLPEPLVFSRGSTIPFKLRVDPPSPNPHPSPPLTPPDITFTLLLLSNLSPSSLSLAFAQFPPPGMVGALPGPGLVQAWNGDTEDTSVVECSNVEYRPPDFEPFTSVGRSEEARAFAGSLDVGGVCPSFEVAEIACAYVLRVGIRYSTSTSTRPAEIRIPVRIVNTDPEAQYELPPHYCRASAKGPMSLEPKEFLGTVAVLN